jgi:phosphatidylglycerol:prolipoprotein diacylglycerol transferase
MCPTLFHIAGYPIRSFGVLLALGSLAVVWIASRACPRLRLDPVFGWRLYPFGLVGGILGAKIWAVVELAAALDEPSTLFALVNRAAYSFYGGLVGAAAGILLKARRAGVSPWAASTILAPGCALGVAIGRVGCFLDGHCYGVATSLPWGVAFPQGCPPTAVHVHPAQLYEALWMLGAAAFLWRRLGRSRLLFAEYLIFQGAGRFSIEFVRPEPVVFWFLTMNQIASALLIASGIVGLLMSYYASLVTGVLSSSESVNAVYETIGANNHRKE